MTGPLYSLDRWRQLGEGAGGENYFLDVKTVEFPGNQPAHLWIKTLKKTLSYIINSYEIDCKSRRLQTTAAIEYDKDDKVLNDTEVSSGWQRVIPETRGERLYNGMCAAKP